MRLLIFALCTVFSLPFLAQAQEPLDPMAEKKSDIAAKNEPIGTVIAPKVFFVSLKDGAKVSKTLKLKFGLTGMKVMPAGNLEIGTGHHHVLIDGEPIAKGQVVPKDEKNLHFGKGETETTLELTPGEHKLTLQFADGNHLSYGPELSQTIKVKVK